MTARSVLITGGAGFIGSHLADHLLASGHVVRALDDLSPQVHGEARARQGQIAHDRVVEASAELASRGLPL